MYDFLIVGAGLFGSVFAHEANKRGKRCLVIDKRQHLAGNIYTDRVQGIDIHQYGPHIFHTKDKVIWTYMNQFADFNRFTYSPIARFGEELYNLPFNMNTFHQLWGVVTPEEAKEKIESQVREVKCFGKPQNLEEQAISQVGTEIYEKLIKGYTEKQWGRSADELPAFIIKRIPVRFRYDNNYFDDLYQGIPTDGYTKIVEKMLAGVETKLNTDFFADRKGWMERAKKVIFTGMIDAYYDYCFGALQYRSLRFEAETLEKENHQGVAVVNFTARDVPFTRVIEHKHFTFGTQPQTVITKEYPAEWAPGSEAFYPVNDGRNNEMYDRYKERAEKDQKVIFGGRLGLYAYMDMDQTVRKALICVEQEMESLV